MNLGLTSEQEQFRELAREWVDREVVPHATAWDRAEQVDTAIVGKLAGLGFLGLGIDEELGGSGGDFLTYCLMMEELGRGDTSVRGIVSVSLGLVAKSIQAYGTDAQKSRWLPALTGGETLGCFGLTEPGTGSDASGLTTRAVRDGDGWVITGEKIFITNGTWAGVALIFARTGGPGPSGITAFLINTDMPGFIRKEVKGKLGLRGQATAEIRLDAVRVGDEDRLGPEGSGFKIAMAALDKGRIAVAAGSVGLSRGCLEASIGYAKERTQFGKPIASYQLVQEMITDIAVETDAARLLVWRAADLVDRGLPFKTEASMAKLFATEAAVKAANQAIQIFGGYGYVDEFPVGKAMRDARVTTLYEGTSQIQKLLIGRALTGISAF
ncbi:acyl-CoA dehydrogenase family protein [Actinoplanes sp. G11-F43]|uniref:acyl-CoA dehydrogenase family protein n=1 Tax=Actinoplanes sp. G11-F43 TaxID=3424130 RepID=UPI003D32B4B6